MGAEIAELETAIAELSHARHAIGCASGTDAILLPVRALNLKPGDEVIAPAFTFFATAARSTTAADGRCSSTSTPDTFNIDPDAIAAAITPRTRAIVVGRPLRPDGGDGTDSAARREARHRRDRGRRAGDRRAPQDRRQMAHGRRTADRRHLLVLPEQEPRRLGRRRHDDDAGRRARRAPQAAAAARRRQAVSSRGGRPQLAARHAAGRDPARQAAAPGRLERRPPRPRRALQRGVRRLRAGASRR